MNYIVCKRLRKNTIQGPTNLKYDTECESIGDIIYYNQKPICSIRSQDAYDYFARNDDGRGLDRFKLTQTIMKLLRKPDADLVTRSAIQEVMKAQTIYDRRWMAVWSDERIGQFRRKDHADFWVWNFDFYNAEIKDLEYIVSVISKIV